MTDKEEMAVDNNKCLIKKNSMIRFRIEGMTVTGKDEIARIIENIL